MKSNCTRNVVLSLVLLLNLPFHEATATESKDVLDATGLQQGLCLVIGEFDGKLTSALAKDSKLYVQGCTKDAASLPASRKALVDAGVIHRASIILREAEHLPYSDNLINLVVVPDWTSAGIDLEEVVRVLTPGGTAAIRAASSTLKAELKSAAVSVVESSLSKDWTLFRKSVDPGLGDWTQFKGGADQSYVSEDSVVAPWKEIQWIGDPRWGSLYSSYSAFVTAGGRIYFKETRAAPGGNQWYVVARDAFNGVELWRAKSGPVWKKTYFNDDFTMTCDKSRVYLVEDKQLVARDGKTGEILKEYALKYRPKEATVSGDYLIASSRPSYVAFDRESAEPVWQGGCHGHPAAVKNTLYVAFEGNVEAVNLSVGQSLWKSKVDQLPEKPRSSLGVVVMHKGKTVYVVWSERWKSLNQVAAFDAASGKPLWKTEGKFTHGVLPFAEEVWCMQHQHKPKGDDMRALVLDARTGKTKRDYEVKGEVMSKCWGARATANHLMYSNGWYLDRKTGESTGHPNTRSPCRIGQQPANGLTYFLPHHCDCKVTIRGMLALGKPGARNWFPTGDEQGDFRLASTGVDVAPAIDRPDDWSVYRGNMKRSGSAPTKLPTTLKTLWSQELGATELTQATVAYGSVYSAEQRAGRVHCRDATSGEPKWSFVADGRIEFPPTLHKGICLVGTCAGTVYGLDASNGREVWRLRAAPAQKFVGDRNQLGSSWPVVGGVLVRNGVAYFSVGHTQSQLGGMWLYAVDPASGKVKWRERGGTSGDMFVADDKILVHTASAYDPDTGERSRWKKLPGILQTTRYLSTVSIADYIACVAPSLSHKKHIELTDGRIKGDCIAFNDQISVAGWRYTPGTPGWKEKKNTNKFFIHAKGSTEWNLHDVDQQMLSIVLAGDAVYAAGVPTSQDPDEPAELWVLSTTDGTTRQTIMLKSRPVYDGLSAAGGLLYLATESGELICFGAKQ